MSYNDLIQDKRAKMLFLIILLIFYPLLNVTGINVTYIVQKSENVLYPSCIAEDLERYVGIGWVYPIPKTSRDLPHIESKFIPPIQNEYDCKFTMNSTCNKLWSITDWQIDVNSIRTKELVTDIRWEDLPTIFVSNATEEFKERLDLAAVFKQAFSVRTDGFIEIFVCSGKNPYNEPCYYLFIDYQDIYLKQYDAIPKNVRGDVKNGALEHTKASSNILSQNEWRNFIISSNELGLVQLIDGNLNRILIDHNFSKPLNAMYMFMRSANSSLWKIHQNSFMYTTTTQISRLGPILSLPSKQLCVSILVKICRHCEIIFFYMNKTKKILKVVEPNKKEDWVEIKLKEENIQMDKVNLFVETKYSDTKSNETGGFWAIDNARVCNENEIKVTFLKLNKAIENIAEDNITCQLIANPSWKPKKIVYPKIEDFPEIYHTSTTNSIRLKWADKDADNSISYFIFYQGNDICTGEPHNLERFQSNGFISTKYKDVTLRNLIPYTVYNVTISTVLHETDKKLFIHTLETGEPNLEELPSNIQLRASETSIKVIWEPVDCRKQYGRLVYTLIVENSSLNFSKQISIQTDTNYEIKGLQPNTQYNLIILTARNGRNLYNNIKTSNYTLHFSTKAGVAPAPENLELYSIGTESAFLRYDLPTNSNGIIKDVQVNKCNSLSFKKCKASISFVKKCSLWPEKYCVESKPLTPFQPYTFRVSLKNLNTPSFGKEVIVRGNASERVPGKPTNITYRIVDCHPINDYCYLNVTWLHPYHQNGTITRFDVVLNSTDEKSGMFHRGVYNIVNQTYYYAYTYQIKNLPYGSNHNIYIRSGNTMYESDFTEKFIKIDDLGHHIDQMPKLLAKGEKSLMFKPPKLDSRLEYYTMTVVVQDYDKNTPIDGDILKNKRITNNLCNKFGHTWISQVIKVDNISKTDNIIIGNSEKERLEPNTKYCVTFIINNMYKGTQHDIVYYEKLKTSNSQIIQKESSVQSSFNHLYLLFIILLIVPIGFLVYRYFRKKRYIKTPMMTSTEHNYETLPCEEIRLKESETNGLTERGSNKTYGNHI
ncbi:uncharacterized protein LOC130446528 [Diorhabda sublineata]|uniref:uncharacterized protein LOC130446528 n=1 Tax=Diorhabda sublineata TaxID=1163346 RepID=UPI0024E1636B|nr:uncharacterized protein LOC130446528 [Diorhabda sublineata]